ncbi:MAG: hemolysin family protein [Bacteroidales bacterium]
MEIIFILLLILLNGFLSMAEIALVSARKSKLEMDARKGNKGASEALKLSDNMDNFLSTIQIGITLVGILTGVFSGQQLSPYLSNWLEGMGLLPSFAFKISQTTIVIIVTYLSLVIGELVPKRLGLNNAEGISSAVARPMRFLSLVSTPFVWLLSKSSNFIISMLGMEDDGKSSITEEEIKAIVREGTETGEVQEVEEDIVGRVFNLGDRNVGSIMTHRKDLVWLDITESNSRVKEKVMENLFNVYPVVNGDLDHLIGVIYLKDLFGQLDDSDFKLKENLRPIQYFPEKLSVYNALEQLKREHVKYGIVTDEFGAIRGIVTMKDIVKALIGSVREIDEEPEIVERADGSLLVEGQCSFYDFLNYIEHEELYETYPFNTISGLILKELERIPKTGDLVPWEDYTFEIVDIDGVRIDKVLVTKNAAKRG